VYRHFPQLYVRNGEEVLTQSLAVTNSSNNHYEHGLVLILLFSCINCYLTLVPASPQHICCCVLGEARRKRRLIRAYDGPGEQL
jgi:hypothetical protein